MAKYVLSSPKPTEEIRAIIQQVLLGVSTNEELDLRQPHPKKSLEGLVSYIIFAYGVLAVYGALSNILLFIHVLQYKLYRDATYAFILNNAISDIVKCVIVLPLSLYVLLVQNWILGELLCNFLPMIQDIPPHVTILTYFFLTWDRCRYLRNPRIERLPAFVCVCGTWLASLCSVLPYPIYIMHLHLGDYFKSPEFQGVSLCIINLTGDMKEYVWGIFFIAYVSPLTAISYFLVTGSRGLSYQNTPAVVLYETRARGCRTRRDLQSTGTDIRRNGGDSDCSSNYSRDTYKEQENGRARYEVRQSQLDVEKEKRTHKYLTVIITIYAICLFPLMILKLAKLALVETYENSSSLDYIYIAFVWLAFLPTCITPTTVAFWQMSSESKERLKRYFSFSKPRRSIESKAISTDSTPPREKFQQGSPLEPYDRYSCDTGSIQ